jgi:hypothetical protein
VCEPRAAAVCLGYRLCELSALGVHDAV